MGGAHNLHGREQAGKAFLKQQLLNLGLESE